MTQARVHVLLRAGSSRMPTPRAVARLSAMRQCRRSPHAHLSWQNLEDCNRGSATSRRIQLRSAADDCVPPLDKNERPDIPAGTHLAAVLGILFRAASAGPESSDREPLRIAARESSEVGVAQGPGGHLSTVSLLDEGERPVQRFIEHQIDVPRVHGGRVQADLGLGEHDMNLLGPGWNGRRPAASDEHARQQASEAERRSEPSHQRDPRASGLANPGAAAAPISRGTTSATC
jgi:hypothetical protein